MSSLLINDSRLISEHDTQAVPTIFAKTFKAILGGDFAALTDSFNISISDKSTGWQMLLTPKDEFLKKIITSISLSGDSDLTSLIIREASGNNSQIIFSNITHPNELTFEQQTNFARLSPP